MVDFSEDGAKINGMKTTRRNINLSFSYGGLRVNVRQSDKMGAAFTFEAMAYGMESGEAMVCASGRIVCAGGIDVTVDHGTLSAELEDVIASRLSDA